MKKIVFATTNEGKLKEAREILKMEIIGSSFEIDEIQSLDPIEVTIKKTQAYFKRFKKPVLVEDVSFVFKALGQLPGPYINDFSKSLGNKGLISLLKGRKDRRAIAQTTLGFCEGKDVFIFKGLVQGRISEKPKGTNGFGWDEIFIPKSETRTFAQMTMAEKNRYSMRAKALAKFKKFLKK